jgi:ferric-dicitrate binding protein FerR (iron transport regulator)
MKPQDSDRIHRALEGLLSPEEWASLQRDVIDDAALRAEYVQQVSLHSQLRSLPTTAEQSSTAIPPAQKPRSRRLPSAVTLVITGSLAAALAVLATVMYARSQQAPVVATLIQAEQCQWAGSQLPTAVNSALTPGTLTLLQGIATLHFSSGATLTLEGPSQLELQDAMHCRLLEGTIVADVPETAHGFTVHTPDMQVIDLGTRFGLTTAPTSGNSQVRVFQGEVQIHRPGQPEPQHLTQGKALTHTTTPSTPDQEIIRPLPQQQTTGWTSLSTRHGRGKDCSVRRGHDSSPLGTEPLLMVKHTHLEKSYNNERHSYLSFDLSSLTQVQVLREAQLQLTPVPSGLGFSALVPDSHFTVYALPDSADEWQEESLTWTTAPGHSQGTPIARFSIPRSGITQPISLSTPELLSCIQRDANQLLTLLIVRETSETDPSGLVHAFASREHPTSPPPTLLLK